jgi:hypothetical protein
MVQAAAAGVVDFSRADPDDPKWWRHLRLVLDQLERNHLKEYHRLYNERVISVLSRADLARESGEKLLEESDSRIDNIAKIMFPWADLDRTTIRQEQAKQLRELWESWFGKLDDPDTQRRIQVTADWLRNTAARRKTPGTGRR